MRCIPQTGLSVRCRTCGQWPSDPLGTLHLIVSGPNLGSHYCPRCCPAPRHGPEPPEIKPPELSQAEEEALERLRALELRKREVELQLRTAESELAALRSSPKDLVETGRKVLELEQTITEIRTQLDLMPAAIAQARDAIADAYCESLRKEKDMAAAELRRINRGLRELLDRAADLLGRSDPIPLEALYDARACVPGEDVVDPLSEKCHDAGTCRANELLRHYRSIYDRLQSMQHAETRKAYVRDILDRLRAVGKWEYDVPPIHFYERTSMPWPPRNVTIQDERAGR